MKNHIYSKQRAYLTFLALLCKYRKFLYLVILYFRRKKEATAVSGEITESSHLCNYLS